jgi:hypothetical protein
MVQPISGDQAVQRENKSHFIGLAVPPSSVDVWRGVYPGSGNIILKARCWHGLPEQRPQDSEKIVTMQRKLLEEEKTYLAANLTELQSEDKVGFRGKNRFSCNIGIAQKVGAAPAAIESVRNPSTDLFSDEAEKYTESAIETEDGTEYFENFPGVFNSPEWIVQGSDAVDPIDVKEETVATPSNLQEIAESTQHPDEQSIFDPFPTGGGNQERFGSGDSGSVRNPLWVCREILEVCPDN